MPEKKTRTLGSVWTFEAQERVMITRPDGESVEVDPVDGSVLFVLTLPGEYVAGDQTITAR